MLVRRTLILLALVAAPSTARLLAPPAAKGAASEEKHAVEVKPHKDAAVAKPAPASKNASSTKKAEAPHKDTPKASKNASVAPKKNMTAEEQLASLKTGLETIAKLQSALTQPEPDVPKDKQGVIQFAEGAMTSELHKKDSVVWSTINDMLSVTTKAMASMQGKSKAEKEKELEALEGKINKQAVTLHNVTNRVGVEQERHSEEYLLGVLMQHQKWSMEAQLNVTKRFADNCVQCKYLLEHHNASQPLAPQLAALMDSKKKIEKKVEKKGENKAEKAAKLLLQLVSTLRRARAM